MFNSFNKLDAQNAMHRFAQLTPMEAAIMFEPHGINRPIDPSPVRPSPYVGFTPAEHAELQRWLDDGGGAACGACEMQDAHAAHAVARDNAGDETPEYVDASNNIPEPDAHLEAAYEERTEDTEWPGDSIGQF